ncbi:MAG: hypothetical protein AB7O32_04040 [Vicinamibacterales bacterium]
MKHIRSMSTLALALMTLALSPIAAPAAAEGAQGAQGSQTMTATDVQRLENAIADAQRDVTQVQQRDLASQLESQLNDLRDEAVYLKVKIRKGDAVSRTEYFDLRDKVDDLRSRARGTSTARTGSSTSSASSPARGAATRGEVPAGTEFDVKLSQALSSSTAQVEDRFEAVTQVDLMQEDRVLVPAGSTMRGVVSSVKKAGRLERRGSLTLAFDRITIRGKDYPIRATVTDVLESEGVKGEATKIGTGAGVGAILGGIFGGVKGAITGILIGGGGTIAATEGEDVEITTSRVLRVKLDAPLDLR